MSNNSEENYRLFLKTLFNDDKKEYREIKVNGFYIIRRIHDTKGTIDYAVYTPESYKLYKSYKKRPLWQTQ